MTDYALPLNLDTFSEFLFFEKNLRFKRKKVRTKTISDSSLQRASQRLNSASFSLKIHVFNPLGKLMKPSLPGPYHGM